MRNLEPNYDDYSCQFSFGKRPAPENDGIDPLLELGGFALELRNALGCQAKVAARAPIHDLFARLLDSAARGQAIERRIEGRGLEGRRAAGCLEHAPEDADEAGEDGGHHLVEVGLDVEGGRAEHGGEETHGRAQPR